MPKWVHFIGDIVVKKILKMGFLVLSLSKDMCFEIVNVVFSMWFMIWLLVDVLKRSRRDYGDLQMGYGGLGLDREVMWFSSMVCVLCSVIVSCSYLGFGVFEYWRLGVVGYKSVLCVLTWFMATVVVISSYSMKRTSHRGFKRWPFVLILWWVFSFSLDLFSVIIYLLTHFRSIKLPHFVPEATIVEFVVFPFLLVLFFLSVLPARYDTRVSEFESPLIRKGESESCKYESHSYSGSGVWSKLTFRWLNPLFAIGRAQKLELPNIPSIPHSETAECASLILEESLRKQKTVTLSLPQVIASAIWKSLATNAVFAGIVFVSVSSAAVFIVSI